VCYHLVETTASLTIHQDLFIVSHVEPHRWFNGLRARFECGWSWVRDLFR